MIYLTGDTHRDIDLEKIDPSHFDYSKTTRNDYLIILGDFGGLWDKEDDDTFLQFYEQLPITVLWIDGNHENFDLIDAYPVEMWHGGKVHRIKENIIHLMRGQIYTIDGHTFFTFGGATSVDRAMRSEGISWWARELPNKEELEEGLDNLDMVNWKVDYVLTHCAPQKILKTLVPQAKGDILNKYLQRIYEDLSFSHWFFGHYHLDKDIDSFSVLFNRILEILPRE